MIRKFECKDCHHQFEADDQQWVECPKCHSDNVGDVKRELHVPEWVGKAAAGVVGALIIGVGGYFAFKHFNTTGATATTDSIVMPTFETVEAFDNYANENYDGVTTPRLSIDNKQYNDQNATYSFHIKAEFLPEGSKPRIEVCEVGTGKVVATSTDGNFTGVPCSTGDLGQYNIRVVDAGSNKELVVTEFVGFDKQQKVAAAWTAADLEKAINNYKVSMVDCNNIADNCQIVVTNLEKGDLSDNSSFTALQERIRLNMEFDNKCVVKVDKVETDAQHRITKAEVRILED